MKEVLTIISITLKSKKFLLLILIVTNILLILIYAAIWPSMASQIDSLNQMIQTLPPAFLSAFNIEGQLNGGFESMLVTKQFGSMLPILLLVLTVTLANDAFASEVEHRSILMYLSQPISRTKYYFSKYIGGLIYILLFSLFSVLLAVPIAWMFNLEIVPMHFVNYTISTFLLGVALFSISFMISALTNDSKKVILISIFLFIIAYTINVVSQLSNSLIDLKYLSLIYYFGPSAEIVEFSIPLFSVISLITIIIGYIYFKKKDISIK